MSGRLSPRGQGALEYLLIIGGAVLIAAMVLILLVTSAVPGSQFIVENAVTGYQDAITIEQAFTSSDGGPMAGTCPNGFCDGIEDNLTCPSDCPDPPSCGDGSCNGGEDNSTCSMDCPSAPFCGDMLCNGSESFSTCPGDCADMNPPVVSFAVIDTLAGGQVQIDYAANDPELSTVFSGYVYDTTAATIDALDETTFASGPNLAILSTSPTLVGGLVNNTIYYFRFMACDAVLNCTLLPSQPVIPTLGAGDVNPPIPSLALSAGDKVAVAAFSAADPEGDLLITYTLLYSTNATALDGVQVSGPTNSFDSAPPNVFVVSPAVSIPGLSTYSSIAGQLSVAGIANGTNAYFRLRACDSAGNCDATTPSSSISPSHKAVTVSVGGDEIVYNWSDKRCAILDIPDNPARFFRTSSGITLVAGNGPTVYTTKSTDFSATNLNNGHVCTPAAFTSSNSVEPYTFDNYEWIWATYKEGSTVHAVVHNEYHDTHPASIPPCTSSPTPSNPCWYNSLTHAVSTNDGTTFTQSSPPQSNLIAAGPDPWNVAAINPASPGYHFYGYQGGTNIVKRSDGYYYMIFFRELNPVTATFMDDGHCIMRTNNLSDNSSWRAWDGKEYTIAMNAPYSYPSGAPSPTGAQPCAFISDGFFDQFYPRGVTYNTYLGQYIIVGEGVVGGQCGAYFSLSPDMITWSSPYFLKAGKVGYGPCADGTNLGLTPYPTLVDHTDTSVNFEYSGQNAFIYHSLWNSATMTDVDLIRAPVTFTSP